MTSRKRAASCSVEGSLRCQVWRHREA